MSRGWAEVGRDANDDEEMEAVEGRRVLLVNVWVVLLGAGEVDDCLREELRLKLSFM